MPYFPEPGLEMARRDLLQRIYRRAYINTGARDLAIGFGSVYKNSREFTPDERHVYMAEVYNRAPHYVIPALKREICRTEGNSTIYQYCRAALALLYTDSNQKTA